jgi:hypothetical protein
MLKPIGKVQTKKAYRRNRITASIILHFYVRWRLMAVLSLVLISNESWIVMVLLIRDIDTVCARNFEEVGHFHI